jgi:hypothetical protein
MKKSRHRKHARTILRLADLEHAESAVLNSLASPESQRSYDFAIQNFLEWRCSEPLLALNRIVVILLPTPTGALKKANVSESTDARWLAYLRPNLERAILLPSSTERVVKLNQ